MQLKVNVKKMTGKQCTVGQIELECSEGISTVQELLSEVVTGMVQDFKKKKQRGENFLSVLTNQEIEEKSASGKIGFGILYGKKNPSLEKSIQAAWECFEDGMVALFIDGVQMERLKENISLHEGSELTFVKLIPLAGRMW